MDDYVLVIKQNNGLRIGNKRYTEQAALTRIEELKLVGITSMEAMHIDAALGVN